MQFDLTFLSLLQPRAESRANLQRGLGSDSFSALFENVAHGWFGESAAAESPAPPPSDAALAAAALLAAAPQPPSFDGAVVADSASGDTPTETATTPPDSEVPQRAFTTPEKIVSPAIEIARPVTTPAAAVPSNPSPDSVLPASTAAVPSNPSPDSVLPAPTAAVPLNASPDSVLPAPTAAVPLNASPDSVLPASTAAVPLNASPDSVLPAPTAAVPLNASPDSVLPAPTAAVPSSVSPAAPAVVPLNVSPDSVAPAPTVATPLNASPGNVSQPTLPQAFPQATVVESTPVDVKAVPTFAAPAVEGVPADELPVAPAPPQTRAAPSTPPPAIPLGFGDTPRPAPNTTVAPAAATRATAVPPVTPAPPTPAVPPAGVEPMHVHDDGIESPVAPPTPPRAIVAEPHQIADPTGTIAVAGRSAVLPRSVMRPGRETPNAQPNARIDVRPLPTIELTGPALTPRPPRAPGDPPPPPPLDPVEPSAPAQARPIPSVHENPDGVRRHPVEPAGIVERVDVPPPGIDAAPRVAPAAARAIAEPTTPLRTDLLAQTIASQARQLAPGVPLQLRFALHPEELGTVRIRIQVSGEQLRVEVVTSNSGATGALQAGVPRLVQHLQTAGFPDAEVSLALDSTGDHEAHQPQDENGRDPDPRPRTATVESEPVTWADDRYEPRPGPTNGRLNRVA